MHIYWQKGFLYCGNTIPFHTNWRSLGSGVGGLGFSTRYKFIKRFELYSLYHNNNLTFLDTEEEVRFSMNVILSKITSLNYQISEVHESNLIRLYLIKSYRGKSQAMGKPSRGQRTWSNAWTAYKYNNTLLNWITTIQKTLEKEKKEEQLNFIIIKKKLVKSSKEGIIKQPEKKKSNWF